MKPGKVYLIGAGPGDPELLTMKAVRALGEAHVVLVDDLVNPAVLEHAGAHARIVPVGKRGGCASTPQSFIEQLMLREARAGQIVARVKGGDPFVFGRGGEELAALCAAGIEVEVVQGITSGIAAPARLGIPVTHRNAGRGVAFITGHTQNEPPDWAALVASKLTLVIYMGVANAADIRRALLDAGMSGATPVAAIQSASTADERSAVCTLDTMHAAIIEHRIGSPAIIVIGEVVRLAGAAACSIPGARAEPRSSAAELRPVAPPSHPPAALPDQSSVARAAIQRAIASSS